ncbi:hypothetical protein, partial [Hominenteromicrobium sp.]|uniref:hypothetical protein n=1 Tax=Hominenteromicrobium sp. TaxID=3073581 RepID=UPI003A8E2D50
DECIDHGHISPTFQIIIRFILWKRAAFVRLKRLFYTFLNLLFIFLPVGGIMYVYGYAISDA